MSKNVRTALERTRAPKETRLVLAILAAHAGNDLLAWPGEATIARLADLDERTVRRHLPKLRDLGEVQIFRRGIKGKSTNVYRVAILAPDFEVIESDGNRTPMSGSEEIKTGHPCPVSKQGIPDTHVPTNRAPMSSRSPTERKAPSYSPSETTGEDSVIAEKQNAPDPSVFTSNRTDIASGTDAGLLGDHAREKTPPPLTDEAIDADWEAFLVDECDLGQDMWAAE